MSFTRVVSGDEAGLDQLRSSWTPAPTQNLGLILCCPELCGGAHLEKLDEQKEQKFVCSCMQICQSCIPASPTCIPAPLPACLQPCIPASPTCSPACSPAPFPACLQPCHPFLPWVVLSPPRFVWAQSCDTGGQRQAQEI